MMKSGTGENFETPAAVPRWLFSLCLAVAILWLAAHALTFLSQRWVDQRSGYENVSMQPLAGQVRTAACELAIELANYRSEHLSAEALKLSPKPPLGAET